MTKYRVLTDELIYPTDPDVIRRLRAGENLGWGDRGKQHVAHQGDLVEDVPTASIKGLLAAKWIEEIEEEAPRTRATRHAEPEPDTPVVGRGEEAP